VKKAKNTVNYVVNGSLGKLGLQLRRLPSPEPTELPPAPQPELPEIKAYDPTPFIWLSAMGIKTVLDIGAETGHFSEQIRQALPIAQIIAFEPHQDRYKKLVQSGEKLRYFKAHNIALSNKVHKIKLDHSRSASKSSADISAQRLDDLELKFAKPLLIKVSANNMETKIIEGGRETIAKASAVLAEVNFAGPGRGHSSFDEIYTRLQKLGFEFHGHLSQNISKTDGSVTNALAIFKKDTDG